MHICLFACLVEFPGSQLFDEFRFEGLKTQALFIAEHIEIAGTSFENMAIQSTGNDHGIHRNHFRNLPALFILAWVSISEQSGNHE
jgi:hypothetical protein